MRKSRRKKKNIRTYIGITISLSAVLLSILAACVCLTVKQKEKQTDRQIAPDELLLTYMNRISEQKYGQMYEMTDLSASGQIQKQDFIKRNKAIYQGMEIQNMKTKILSYQEEEQIVRYETSFDTPAGNICFENEAFFVKTEKGYRLAWMTRVFTHSCGQTIKYGLPCSRRSAGKSWIGTEAFWRGRVRLR